MKPKKNNQCKLKLVSKQAPHLIPTKKSSPKFDVNNLADIKRLEQSQKGKHKFRYDTESNKHYNKIKLFVAPVAVLGGRLGVFTAQNISASTKTIGCYAGKRSKRHNNADSLYVFQINDTKDQAIEFIDANKLRDWSGLINHSPTPNLFVAQRKSGHKINVCFYPDIRIKKGEQLTFDYGKFYFNDPNVNHYYIHPSNNWLKPDDLYLQFKNFYAPGLYRLDTKSLQDLQFAKSTVLLLPSIFKTILQQNISKLSKQLKNYPVDLLAYACQYQKICKDDKQQHLTALMFACYIGAAECISLLTKHGADINRCMLVAGYSPFILLMLGNAPLVVAEEIGKQFLKKMRYPLVQDKFKLSLLHYAILRNSPQLVKLILNIYYREDYIWLEDIADREDHLPPHADFDYCIKHNQIEILKLLINDVYDDKELFAGINKNQFFRTSTLAEIKPAQLLTLQKFLQQPKFKRLQTQTRILSRINRAILRKTKNK